MSLRRKFISHIIRVAERLPEKDIQVLTEEAEATLKRALQRKARWAERRQRSEHGL